MKPLHVLLVAICIAAHLCRSTGPVSGGQSAKPDRQVAVTIDDLPSGMADRLPAADITAMTAKLLGTLRDQKIPVVGFVNEKKLYKPGEVDERIKALADVARLRIRAGQSYFQPRVAEPGGIEGVGRRSDSGRDRHAHAAGAAQDEAALFPPSLSRHRPRLETRREAEAFLVQRGYRIAPITLDGWDWMFAGVYEDAKKRNDTELQQQLVKEYLAYHDAVFAYTEQLSAKVVGYEPKQILLLHASNLEADHIGELLDVLRKRGYRFITLEDALSDPAYSLPNTYVGEEGTGWIDQWAITQGKIPRGAPTFPQWVIDRTKQLHLSTGTVTAPEP